MPGSIEDLFSRYEILASGTRAHLSADEARSVLFYRIDRAMADGEPSAEFPRSQPVLWVKNLRDTADFVGEFGRMARENNRLPVPLISARERTLADWVRYQRRPATRDRLCTYQVMRLETVPGFSWSPHDDLWTRSYDDYLQFVLDRRRSPSSRSVDVRERQLAIWASKQRYHHRRDALSEERAGLLNELQIWSWGAR
jgi:hypothetical protein